MWCLDCTVWPVKSLKNNVQTDQSDHSRTAISLINNKCHVAGTCERFWWKLKELHWLPINYQIQYKEVLLMYMVHINRRPQYLRDTVVSADSEPGLHHLRSATNLNYIFPRIRTKFGERAFSVSGPLLGTVWLSPSDRRQLWLSSNATWSHTF